MNQYLQRLHDAIASAAAGMSERDLLCRAEGKWCAGEILEHLYLTYTGTAKGCERCLESGKRQVGEATLQHRVAKFVVVKMRYMPRGRKAPEMTKPKGTPAQQVAENITNKIIEMDALLERCEKRFGSTTVFLNHPVLGPLTGTEWCKFHWVHGRHHLRQLRTLSAQRLAGRGAGY